MCCIRSCCMPFPGETWINECVSVHSREVTVISEWPKMNFCSSLAQWASEPIGVTPRTRMTPAYPSVLWFLRDTSLRSPHNPQTDSAGSSLMLIPAQETPPRGPHMSTRFLEVLGLLSSPSSSGRACFIWKETATFQWDCFTQVLLLKR